MDIYIYIYLWHVDVLPLEILRDWISIGIQKDMKDVRRNIPTCSKPSTRRILTFWDPKETDRPPKTTKFQSYLSGWELNFSWLQLAPRNFWGRHAKENTSSSVSIAQLRWNVHLPLVTLAEVLLGWDVGRWTGRFLAFEELEPTTKKRIIGSVQKNERH